MNNNNFRLHLQLIYNLVINIVINLSQMKKPVLHNINNLSKLKEKARKEGAIVLDDSNMNTVISSDRVKPGELWEEIKEMKKFMETNEHTLTILTEKFPNLYKEYPRIFVSVSKGIDINVIKNFLDKVHKIKTGQSSYEKENELVTKTLESIYIDPLKEKEKNKN